MIKNIFNWVIVRTKISEKKVFRNKKLVDIVLLFIKLATVQIWGQNSL